MISHGQANRPSALRERVVRFCSKLPGAEPSYPFGEGAAVFKLGGRMFAVVSEDDEPGRLTLKCDPDHAAYLIQNYDEIVPGYHMNKRHWITITLAAAVPAELIDELIADAYELIRATSPTTFRRTLPPFEE